MEGQAEISVHLYKSLKEKDEQEAKDFLKKNVRLVAKKIIDEMPEGNFNKVFDVDINKQGESIFINLKLK